MEVIVIFLMDLVNLDVLVAPADAQRWTPSSSDVIALNLELSVASVF